MIHEAKPKYLGRHIVHNHLINSIKPLQRINLLAVGAIAR